ncbi:MAG: STM4011 family radical SAM protein [Pirellulales bacterium]|nr:STM4011 family radical SAM protein [Pirellulales bacterium]
MALKLRILYRGPLSSCNYDCGYCPFAKHQESVDELRQDRTALLRFVEWASAQNDIDLGILFTPWGEALTRRIYQQAITRLSRLPRISKVAIQTNLSSSLTWLDAADCSTIALWCTYHPSQASRAAFLKQCSELGRRGVRFSVGMVGLHKDFAEIDAMRAALPKDIYLWINAYKDQPNYYTEEQIAHLTRVDPHFGMNNQRHRSLGEMCTAGESAISVDGNGGIRRCHFVSQPIGNIYEANWRDCLQRRTCPNQTCGCYIGYAFLPKLRHEELFGAGLLERIPRHQLGPEYSNTTCQ